MDRKKKFSVYIYISIILLVCFSSITWFYPYSILSVQKSVSYNPDNIVIQNYITEVKKFRKIYEENNQNDLVNNKTARILQFYEQNWLLREKPIKIHYQDLDLILSETKEVRNILIELTLFEGYSQEAKEYLKLNIQQYLAIEEGLIELKKSKIHSRSTLIRQFKNLNSDIIESLDIYTYFYNDYLSGATKTTHSPENNTTTEKDHLHEIKPGK